ncbi:zinc finger protein 836-like [Haliotis rubra]|uniref:zinc finger protein 836-like n=1 Tax=Haliotis rubra TaxID=36100 RepID=UPI001EE513F3|nr:zinc finger protein 836-like [Haliotis rubra]
MEVQSSSDLGSPSHSYNTRHKRKHQDISQLVEDQDTASVGQDASASKYIRNSAEFKPFESLSQALNHSRTNVDGLQESDVSESLSQNVNSCSQQLLNIIKSVGASKVTEEPKKKDVTILKSMLNSVNDEEKFEPPANYSVMSRLLDTPTSSIGVRSTTFLNRSYISPPIQRSCSQVPAAKQVSKFRMIKPKPSTIGTPTQTQIASLRIGLRKRRSRSAEKSCSYDTGISALPTECPYQCRLCGSAFRSTPLLEEHMHVHFGSMPFGCSICPQSFMTAKELEDHMKVHASKLSPAVVYKCTVCGDVFDTEREHNEHRINHETFQQVQSTDHNKVRSSQHAYDQVHMLKNVHACKQCGEVFQDIHKYVLHVDQHSGWYKCEKCDKVFMSKIVFQEHILNCSGQNYICSECGKTFMSKMDLNYHIMFEHKQQGVTCGICSAVFCYESHLKEHEVQQHGSELKLMLQGAPHTQPDTVDDISMENGCKISDMMSLSVQRSSGSMAISDFAVQCLSDPTPSVVVTISDSE